jgi:ABC-type transport system involved in cytochrome c biogenesis permease subunit
MIGRLLPWILLGLAAVMVGGRALPRGPASDGMRLEEFASIPVQDSGRTKPLDTLARTLLNEIAEKESFQDADGKRQPAIRWLIDVMIEDRDPSLRARKHRVFRIDDPQLWDKLGLSEEEGHRYSIEQFVGSLSKIAESMQKAQERKDKDQKLDAYDRQLMKFASRLSTYQAISNHHVPLVTPPPDGTIHWRSLAAGDPFEEILSAYAEGDAPKFNKAVQDHLARMHASHATVSEKSGFEEFYNRVSPFGQSRVIYLAAFVLICLSWLGGWSRPLNRSAQALIWFAFVPHTLGLLGRMYISGRIMVMVTNLYSSAVFIGWGIVLLGMILERIYRLGLCSLVAAAAGFLSLLISDALAMEGDTIAVQQAVLDTQFWLATHVTCITLGYATTFLSGLFGVVLILQGVFTRSQTDEIRRTLSRIIYGVTCFAMFFSFVGTVLGGLWADDSWGRFWGWDPKENGALMIVLWNALMLHARWGGLVRERGLACLTVFGNIVTAWSWFGVNELSVGLHTYGFTEGRAMWLVVFVGSQLAIIGLGWFTPPDRWRSPIATRGAHAPPKGE